MTSGDFCWRGGVHRHAAGFRLRNRGAVPFVGRQPRGTGCMLAAHERPFACARFRRTGRVNAAIPRVTPTARQDCSRVTGTARVRADRHRLLLCRCHDGQERRRHGRVLARSLCGRRSSGLPGQPCHRGGLPGDAAAALAVRVTPGVRSPRTYRGPTRHCSWPVRGEAQISSSYSSACCCM